MTNIDAARQLLARVVERGVREFCVCAGSRNSPLLAVLGAASSLQLYSFVDERAAAFFALGRIKLTGNPVAVVTTSGTAAAELLPAAVEARYSALPLVMLTADRPASFRGTGAPQSIEQVGLFGVYADTDLAAWRGARPLHLNVEFDEPLVDAGLPHGWDTAVVATARGEAHSAAEVETPFTQPLVLVGELNPTAGPAVEKFLLELGAPVFAEPLSGLRESGRLEHLLLRSGERIVGRGDFDGVIRIGGVPTLRFWRDLQEHRTDLPVMHFTDVPFTGLTRGVLHPLASLPAGPKRSASSSLIERDREFAREVDRLIDGEPESEVGQLRQLSRHLPEGSRVYLGNSLPIREWDLAAVRDKRFVYAANRGANGIDGQLSTFFGWCDVSAPNTAVIGDLTTLYDLNAPWVVPQLAPGVEFRIVIVNNGGGRIFSRVPSLAVLDREIRERVIENQHDLRFEPWAAMWGLAHGDPSALRGVIELRPDLAATRRFWDAYDALWSRR